MIITVEGSHRVELAPERGVVRVRVSSESADKAEVMACLQRDLGALVDDLDSLGAEQPSPISRRVVETPRTNTWVDQLPDGTRVVHHQASAQVTAEFVDLERLSQWVTAWGEREGLSIDDIAWTLTDQTRAGARDEVLTRAVADARDRAEVLARAAGCGDLRFLEIADPGLLGDATPEAAAAGAQFRTMQASAAFVGAEPDTITTSATIQVRFEADPR